MGGLIDGIGLLGDIMRVLGVHLLSLQDICLPSLS